nr:hypothetical protein Iba_chr10aCG12240 [Ipomoea batatas]
MGVNDGPDEAVQDPINVIHELPRITIGGSSTFPNTTLPTVPVPTGPTMYPQPTYVPVLNAPAIPPARDFSMSELELHRVQSKRRGLFGQQDQPPQLRRPVRNRLGSMEGSEADSPLRRSAFE